MNMRDHASSKITLEQRHQSNNIADDVSEAIQCKNMLCMFYRNFKRQAKLGGSDIGWLTIH